MWTSNWKTVCVGLLVSLWICGSISNLHAQVAGASISGTVIDGSSRVVSNGKIDITNVATGVTREATTNDEGLYSACSSYPRLDHVPARRRSPHSMHHIRGTVRGNLEAICDQLAYRSRGIVFRTSQVPRPGSPPQWCCRLFRVVQKPGA
jgi:hypothetical protein